MEKNTVGHTHYAGSSVPVGCEKRHQFREETGSPGQYRLIFCGEGSGIVLVNGVPHPCIAPCVICANEDEFVSVEREIPFPGEAALTELRIVWFHPSYINASFTLENVRDPSLLGGTDIRDTHWFRPFLSRDGGYRGIVPVNAMNSLAFSRMFDSLQSELESRPDGFWPCRARSYLLEMLFILFRLHLTPVPAPTDQDTEAGAVVPSGFAGQVVTYLYRHYRERLTMSDISREFATNRTTLNEKFIRETRVPVMTYLIRLRVRLAALLLRDTGIPVSEVCDRAGFQDLSHFGRIFRKYTGFSPSEYRQKYSWLAAS